jgi:hypothetical protein
MIFIATTGIITVLALAFVSHAGQARGPAPAQPAQAAPRGQAAPAAAATRSPAGIPRMPDGKPNFTGLWQSMVTADWDIQDHVAQAGPFYQLGAIGTIPPGQGIVDGNEIPYKPEALAQKKTNHDNWLTMDPVVKCYMPGVPRATYMPYPFMIVQSQKDLAIAYQFATSNRVINVGKPAQPSVDTWMGTSNGRWQGDTLIVDVIGMNDQTWFDRAGNYHSDALHVVESYKYRTPDVIDYEATIEDKNVFTQPWKISLPLYRHMEKNAQLGEFKCVEFTEELIYGHLRKKP